MYTILVRIVEDGCIGCIIKEIGPYASRKVAERDFNLLLDEYQNEPVDIEIIEE